MIGFLVTDQQFQALKALAAAQGCTQSEVLRAFLDREADHREESSHA